MAATDKTGRVRNGASRRKIRSIASRASVATLLAVAIAGCISAHKAGTLEATVRRDSAGVPHILADDYAGIGFGYGYTTAEDSACVLADRWLTVSAARARTLGPGEDDANITSDIFWQYVIDTDVAGKALQASGPDAVLPEVRELVRGFAAGYNHYLAQVNNEVNDPACPDPSIIRPITERDVYHQALYLASLLTMMSENGGYRDIARAAPPADGQAAYVPAHADSLPSDQPRQLPGSNMAALGGDATDNGKGMMFTNPHWGWDGPNRFLEAHFTIPGKLNVYGSPITGIPVISFGNNEHVAWSHTVSTPRRGLLYRLKLGSKPTTYLVDGVEVPMEAHPVRVSVKTATGTATREHTIWTTRFGFVLANARQPWARDSAAALFTRDLNLRWLNQDFRYGQARSVAEIRDIAAQTLGWGWFNTGAADDQGNAVLGPMQSVPYITDEQLADCAVGPDGSDSVLDGSRSACAVRNDSAAPVPGVYALKALPVLSRRDYVANSNGSPWATNLRAPLEGFPKIMGPERTLISLRTRVGLQIFGNRLNGSDGLPGKRFTLDQLVQLTMDDRVLAGQLWKDQLVALCRKAPQLAADGAACEALAGWHTSFDLDDPGAVLFRVFAEHLDMGQFAPLATDLFTVPFDYRDALDTPRGLNTANPRVLQALVAAVKDLKATKVPLDATLRHYQFAQKGDERIPIPGGPGGMGVYNFIGPGPNWEPGVGWKGVGGGTTYASWVQFTDEGVVGKAILAHSLSLNPNSPWFATGTRLFSEKKFPDMRFYEKDVLADPGLRVTKIRVR